jgi:hypothetical protein
LFTRTPDYHNRKYIPLNVGELQIETALKRP